MKRISIIFLTLVLLLCGCDPATYYFNADEITDTATKIELVYCENNTPSIVNVEENTVLHFDRDSATLVKELNQADFFDFANELSNIRFHIGNESVNSPTGYTLLIHTSDNEITVLSCNSINGIAYGMAAVFSNTGTFIKHLAVFADRSSFEELLTKYFGV